MIYKTAKDWQAASAKRVLLFGMSGLGKTHLANLLRGAGDWFHYSIDYRIGTRYMGEFIADNFKREAMRVPFLRELLLTDSRLYRVKHHLQQSGAAVHLSGQTRRSGQRRRALCRISAASGTAPSGRNCRPAGYAALHRPRARDLRLQQFHLRQRRLDLRGGGPPMTAPIR